MELGGTERRPQRLLALTLELAVEAVGCAGATLSVAHDDAVATVRTTDARTVAIDEAQYVARSGPCVTALGGEEVTVHDFATDGRWRELGELAVDLGVRSSLSIPVDVEGGPDMRCALNLFALDVGFFEDRRADIARDAARVVNLGVGGAEGYRRLSDLVARMSASLDARAAVEQAKGMLMVEHGVGVDEAGELLARRARGRGQAVAETAVEMVQGRAAAPVR